MALASRKMLKLHEVLEGLFMLYMAREAHVQTVDLIRPKTGDLQGAWVSVFVPNGFPIVDGGVSHNSTVKKSCALGWS